MNIIWKLTWKHLLENRKRTVVTVLGIAMSTALITSILLGVFSFFRFFGKVAVETSGHGEAAVYEITEAQASSLKQDERIALAGVTDTDPRVSGVKLDSGKADRFCTGNIMHGDSAYFTQVVVSDYEGTLPENASQIAVEAQFLSDNGLDLHIGGTLAFTQGYRYVQEGGELQYLAGSYRSREQFEPESEAVCTITAILHGNRPTTGFDILRGMDHGTFPETKYSQARISLKKSDHTAIVQIQNIAKDYAIEKYELNTEYLLSVFAFEGSGGTYRSLFIMLGIGLVIVIVTSVILIVNSIEMSLAERMRYLGMLASVGATGRQKRFSIYSEAMILAMAGIPLGLIIGYLGTKATLAVMGERILAADIIAGAEGMRGTIPVIVSPWVIAAIILCAGITVYISAMIPARKAAKIMPVDALRQNETIRVSARSLRVSPWIRRIFGCEGELACKNIRRNGLKGTVITVSIAVSVILFLTISFVCDSITRLNQYDYDLPFQIAATCSLAEKDQLRSALEQMESVDRVFSAGLIQFPFEKTEGQQITLANRDLLNPAYRTKDYAAMKPDSFTVAVIDDQAFDQLVKDNGLDPEKYFGTVLRGLLLNNYYHEKNSSPVFNAGIIGQVLHYDEAAGFPPAVEIGDFIAYDPENDVFRIIPKGVIGIYVPCSLYYEKASETIGMDQLTCDLGVVTETHARTAQAIYELMETEGYHNYSVTDLTDSLAAMNTVTMLLKTAMYGFSILLTLIAVANIVNTISTGVLMRRKEFAMYKSVGMAESGFRKMIRMETILYGVMALAIGIPVSLLLSYLMYSSFEDKLYAFAPDGLMYLAVTAGVFALLGLCMALSVNKIRNDRIIEALKEDAV